MSSSHTVFSLNHTSQSAAHPVKDASVSVKTALVLSSGGLFGAYQVGVWNYLAESGFRPDIVVGASVGAINGWAIAGGCSGDELTERWLDESQSNVLKRKPSASLSTGYFHREPLERLTTTVYSNYKRSADFGLVVVELPFLRSRLISGASVTANHLLASASIPVAMPTVMIDGQRFTDGGFARRCTSLGRCRNGRDEYYCR